MLEILALYYICKNLGNRLRNKGYSPLWLQILAVLFWFGGEFIGAVVASIVLLVINGKGGGDGINPMTYVGALVGAAIGAGLAFLIAALMPDRTQKPEGFPVEQRL